MKIKNILITALFSIAIFTSCESEDDFTGHSKLNFSTPNVSYEIIGESGTDIIVDESAINPDDGMTYTIKATLSEVSNVDTYIDLAGTGTASGTDYSISRIFIGALEMSGTGSVTFYRTGELEGDETLQVKANTKAPNVNGSETFNFTITNDYKNDNLIMNFGWCDDFDFDFSGTSVSGNYGELIDMDFLVYDASFALVKYDAATGSCPEHTNFGGLDDGLYYVAAFCYDNYMVVSGDINIPIITSYEQEYFVENTPFTHNVLLNVNTAGGNTYLGLIATVEKTGHEFVVTPQ